MQKLPSLVRAVALSAILAAAGGAVLLVATVQQYTGQTETAAQTKVADQAAKALQFTATSLLQREWDAMSTIAPRLAASSYPDLTSVMTSIEQVSDAVSWAGLASVSGEIIAGSNGLHEGTNVAQQDWFSAGLQEGGVHVDLRNDDAGANAGLISLSIPTTTAEGVTTGVLIYTIPASWLDEVISEGANRLDVDYAVVSRDGQVVLENQSLVQAPLNTQTLRLVAGGDRSAEVVTSTQDGAYVVSMLASVIEGTVPNFGWGIVVRLPAFSSPSTFVDTLIEMRKVVLGLVAMILACATFFAVSFLMPIQRLATMSKQIAEGKKVYPGDHATSREAAEISDALARIQLEAPTAGPERKPLVLVNKAPREHLQLVVGQN